MVDATREKADWGHLGIQRYLRYVAAFDRVVHCLDAEYYLEAIAILDSLIGDRLASRLGHLVAAEIPVRLSCGQLCNRLVGSDSKNESGAEKDLAFRKSIEEIQKWVKRRNDAMHATAKVIRSDEESVDFAGLLSSHRQNALAGVELLQLFDTLDTAARRKQGKSPATRPNAFFPEKRKNASGRRRPNAT
jgi:hypothetical protein